MTDDAQGDYWCDLDNDGQEEGYDKSIRHLANFYGKNYLEFTLQADAMAGQNHTAEKDGTDGHMGTAEEDDLNGQYAHEQKNRGIEMLMEEMQDSPYTPMALWVEEYAGKNIVQALYMMGLDDYRITGYLVETSDCGKVYEIAADAVYRVVQERKSAF
ncbi:MAG: hypothetical protein K2I53_13680 [Lachnospiraceae bacterium]|nr:hypothetical protein [Lachnospiraceae bacterium]